MGRIPGWERECENFWGEREVLLKVVPLMVGTIADVATEFLKEHAGAGP